MTTERPDRGARALAERLPRAINFRFLPPRIVTDPIWDELADAILANGAVFLEDAAELERLRTALEGVGAAIARESIPRGMTTQGYRKSVLRRLYAASNAALQPEGSAQP